MNSADVYQPKRTVVQVRPQVTRRHCQQLRGSIIATVGTCKEVSQKVVLILQRTRRLSIGVLHVLTETRLRAVQLAIPP